MPLSQTETDLRVFAIEKIGTAMLDVAQAFEIAYGLKAASLPCLGAVLLRFAALVAATAVDRETFINAAGVTFDEEKDRQKKSDGAQRPIDGYVPL